MVRWLVAAIAAMSLLTLLPAPSLGAPPRTEFAVGGCVRCDDRYSWTCDVRGWRDHAPPRRHKEAPRR